MNKFTQHIPNFVDWREPKPSFEFETLEELLNHKIVASYSKWDGFTRYAKSGDVENHLMIMFENNESWWVVGRVKDTSVLNELPNYQDLKVPKPTKMAS